VNTYCYDAPNKEDYIYDVPSSHVLSDISLGFRTYKYTGKERDTESGLANFGARYDASSMGRFMSADPVFISADRLTDPQSLNLYAYVRNNPLSLVDPGLAHLSLPSQCVPILIYAP